MNINYQDSYILIKTVENKPSIYFIPESDSDKIVNEKGRIVFKDINLSLQTVNKNWIKLFPENFINKKYIKITKFNKFDNPVFSVYVKSSEVAQKLPQERDIVKNLKKQKELSTKIDEQNKSLIKLVERIKLRFAKLKKSLKQAATQYLFSANSKVIFQKSSNLPSLQKQAENQEKVIKRINKFITKLDDQPGQLEEIMKLRAQIERNNKKLEKAGFTYYTTKNLEDDLDESDNTTLLKDYAKIIDRQKQDLVTVEYINEITENTFARISETLTKRYQPETLKSMIRKVVRDLLLKPEGHNLHFGNFHVVLVPSERRLSIITDLDKEEIGRGKYGIVEQYSSLTQNTKVAFKTIFEESPLIDKDMSAVEKEDFLNFIKKMIENEIYNLERFKRIKDHQAILPGLPFLPVQRLLHSYKLASDQSAFSSERYEMDLQSYLGTADATFENRVKIFYQTLYMGAFCELVHFTNLDIRIENIFIKDGRIAFGDLSGGHFDDGETLTDENRYYVGVAAMNLPQDDRAAIKNSANSVEENLRYREKASVYLISQALYAILAGDYPDIKDLKTELTGKCSSETIESLTTLFKSMFDPEPLERISCLKAFQEFGRIISKDPELKQSLKDYTGPWQS